MATDKSSNRTTNCDQEGCGITRACCRLNCPIQMVEDGRNGWWRWMPRVSLTRAGGSEQTTGPRFPEMPFRDQIWRINFEDGREPAFVAVYNNEITAWTDNAPDALKAYSGCFSPRARRLSAIGMAFYFEGINE